jgi:outer membrane immunogenic protein
MNVKMNFLMAAALVALATVSSADAADLRVSPVYKAPIAIQAFAWNGCYIGANAGWVGSDTSLHEFPSGQSIGAINPLLGQLVTTNYSLNGSGGVAGGQLGCNRQFGNLVLGIEGDLDYSSLRESTTASYPLTRAGNAFQLARTQTITHDLNWFSTVRARGGYAFDRLLVFATGGFAIGRVESSFNQIFSSGAQNLGAGTTTRLGWTVGTGVEYALNAQWSVKAEYLYLDFGTFSYTSPLVQTPANTWTSDIHSREHIVRAGLNYKVDWGGAVVAKY